MKRHFLLLATLSIALSGSITSCSQASAQVNDALNAWFNKKTLIAGTALVSSAVLSLVLYKALSKFNQSFAQWLTGKIFPAEEEFPNVEVTERTPEEMEQMSSQEINTKLLGKERYPIEEVPLEKNDLRNFLKSKKWNEKIIADLRQSPIYQRESYKKDLDDLLVNHYYDEIYIDVENVPSHERLGWAKKYKNFLLTAKGSETGKEGTKYQAFEKLEKDTYNFQYIPYKPSLSDIPLQLSQ
ncbi:MAG TPA: hypothetical protein VKU36_03330 [Candidatus Babeliales bacterium]|nr:hypothetical protein [Candidatus Babeliales bacterium]